MYTIIFDWKRTLYDPESKTLIQDSLQLLKFLKQKKINIILIGKGGSEMNQEVERLKIRKYFTTIIFQEGQKDENLFSPFISKMNPKLTIIIGDRVRSELEIGNELRTITIWVKQGKFSVEKPLNKNQKPTYTVDSLITLKKLLNNKFFK